LLQPMADLSALSPEMTAKETVSPQSALRTRRSSVAIAPKWEASMPWVEAPADLVEAFAAALRDFPEAERRKMFGYPAAFVNGHLCAGLYQDRVVLKLPDEARAALLGLPGAEPFAPMPGRVMGEFVMAPPALGRDPDALRPWLRQALDYGK